MALMGVSVPSPHIESTNSMIYNSFVYQLYDIQQLLTITEQTVGLIAFNVLVGKRCNVLQ